MTYDEYINKQVTELTEENKALRARLEALEMEIRHAPIVYRSQSDITPHVRWVYTQNKPKDAVHRARLIRIEAV